MVGYQFGPITITELVVLIFDDVFSDVFLSEAFWGSSHILRIADRPNWLSLGPWVGNMVGSISALIRGPVRGSPVCSVCSW